MEEWPILGLPMVNCHYFALWTISISFCEKEEKRKQIWRKLRIKYSSVELSVPPRANNANANKKKRMGGTAVVRDFDILCFLDLSSQRREGDSNIVSIVAEYWSLSDN